MQDLMWLRSECSSSTGGSKAFRDMASGYCFRCGIPDCSTTRRVLEERAQWVASEFRHRDGMAGLSAAFWKPSSKLPCWQATMPTSAILPECQHHGKPSCQHTS